MGLCCIWDKVIGFVVLAICLVLLFKWISARKRRAKQAKWDSAGKNVVVLHQFPRATYAPSPSPYPLKLETFLRMHKIQYINDFDDFKSTKGKSPWITFNGINVTDSQLSIEYLCKKLELELDSHLSVEQKAQARTIRSLLEDHLYFILVQDRWIHNGGEVALTHFGKAPPLPKCILKPIFKVLARIIISKQTEGQGLGRHTKEELQQWGLEDFQMLSVLLGDKPYLFGNKPSLVDATLFGFICMLLYVSPEDNCFLQAIKKDFVNLKEHNDRMREKFWPDWEDNCYKGK